MQKYVNLVDLVKSFPTSIYLQKSASIQPRTSLSKFGGKFNSLFIRLLNQQALRGSVSAVSRYACMVHFDTTRPSGSISPRSSAPGCIPWCATTRCSVACPCPCSRSSCTSWSGRRTRGGTWSSSSISTERLCSLGFT